MIPKDRRRKSRATLISLTAECQSMRCRSLPCARDRMSVFTRLEETRRCSHCRHRECFMPMKPRSRLLKRTVRRASHAHEYQEEYVQVLPFIAEIMLETTLSIISFESLRRSPLGKTKGFLSREHRSSPIAAARMTSVAYMNFKRNCSKILADVIC